MKLQSGKTYLTREGNKVTMTKLEGGGLYQFRGSNRWNYSEDGKIFPENLSPQDIVGEANVLKTSDGVEIVLGETYYYKTNAASVFKAIGIDGTRVIYKAASTGYCSIDVVNLVAKPPKPKGFTTEYTVNMDCYSLLYNKIELSGVCETIIDKIRDLEGHRVKITVEVL